MAKKKNSVKATREKSLESWIWDAACSIRGAKDAPKFKDYILPLVFTKRLGLEDVEADIIGKSYEYLIRKFAEAIGWSVVSREEAEQRRGFDPDVSPRDRAKGRSLVFDDLLDAKVREFNPRYAEDPGALLGTFRHLHTDIHGNREFVGHLRNGGKFFDHEEKRDRVT